MFAFSALYCESATASQTSQGGRESVSVRDLYNRGSAQQPCRTFSDLTPLQHSVATEMV